MAIFPLSLDRIAVGVVVVVAVGVIPVVASGYLLKGLLIPTLAYALAAIGLNILTGYAGQLSLGHAAFMAVGAYGAVIAYGRYGWPLLASFLVGGLAAAAVGAVVGLPSLRIKGFYLAVTTLAVQYIVEWGITHVRWIGGGVYATIDVPDLALLGVPLDTGPRKYLLCLATVVVLTVFAKNLVRTRVGRAWMAIRDRDVAAEIMGIGLLRYKMLAFVVSSFYAGVAGALISFCFYQAANIEEYTLTISIRVLGMIIIGGMGSLLGSYRGAGPAGGPGAGPARVRAGADAAAHDLSHRAVRPRRQRHRRRHGGLLRTRQRQGGPRRHHVQVGGVRDRLRHGPRRRVLRAVQEPGRLLLAALDWHHVRAGRPVGARPDPAPDPRLRPLGRDRGRDLAVLVSGRGDVLVAGVGDDQLRRAEGGRPRSEERRVGKECRSRWSAG